MKPDDVSLRDYFAACALQGLCMDYIPERIIPNSGGLTEREVIAERAYDVADAMLRERALAGLAERAQETP